MIVQLENIGMYADCKCQIGIIYSLSVTFYLLQCRDFVKAGADQGLTPSDVILAADITFSCVADPQAAKDVMQLFSIIQI